MRMPLTGITHTPPITFFCWSTSLVLVPCPLNTNLIVQQVSAVGILEEIALELKTDVTAVGCMFSRHGR